MSPGTKLAIWIGAIVGVSAVGIGIAAAAKSPPESKPSTTPNTPQPPTKGGVVEGTWAPTTTIEANKRYRTSIVDHQTVALTPTQIAALKAIDFAMIGSIRIYRAGEPLPGDWPIDDARDTNPNRRRGEFGSGVLAAPIDVPPIPTMRLWVLTP